MKLRRSSPCRPSSTCKPLAYYIESVYRTSAGPQDAPLELELVTGLVGGIHELVLQALEDGRAEQLPALVPSVTRLINRVLGDPV